MPVGILTAGGDCPGLNAAIRAVVTRVVAEGEEVVGVEEGWRGLMEGRVRPLDRDSVRGIISRGGTILGTSRMDPYVHGSGLDSVTACLDETGIETLVVIGGDGSLRTASRLAGEGVPIVGIPKTIDNDIGLTDITLGFHTAVQIVVDAIDRLTTTAEAHNRIMVVEVMGRTTGWIAAVAGLAGGAEAVLVPEVDFDLDHLSTRLLARHEDGHNYSIVVVAEGVAGPGGAVSTSGVDPFGFTRIGGVSQEVAAELERHTGFEARVMSLGYLQRGGAPSAFDRVLGTRFGIRAAELALEGERDVMVALQGSQIAAVSLDAACREVRRLDPSRYLEASWFFA